MRSSGPFWCGPFILRMSCCVQLGCLHTFQGFLTPPLKSQPELVSSDLQLVPQSLFPFWYHSISTWKVDISCLCTTFPSLTRNITLPRQKYSRWHFLEGCEGELPCLSLGKWALFQHLLLYSWIIISMFQHSYRLFLQSWQKIRIMCIKAWSTQRISGI